MDTKKLRQKILDLAIRGKLVPQDPNDEPASVLLERIKAEKERLIKEGKIKRSKKSAKTSDTPHYQQDVPFEVPSSWVWCCITEVTNKITDGTHNSPINTPKGEYKYVTAKNIKSSGVILDNITFVSKEVHQEIYSRCNPEKGDILYIKDGATTGIATVNTLDEPFSLLSSVALIKPSHWISNKYLLYYLQSSLCYSSVRETMKGVGITRITLKLIEKWQIPLPPFAEQKRIAIEIEHWFALIDQIEQGKADLQTTIKHAKSKILDLAIHGKLVPQDPNDEPAIELLKRINLDFTPCDNGHYAQLPDGWCVVTLKDLCENINGLWKGKKEPFVNVGVIRNANFTKDFKLDYSNIEYIDVEQRTFAKRHLENGDLIVEKSGGSDNNPVGRTILYEGKSGVFSFSNFTMVLRMRYNDTILSKYLYYCILAKYQTGAMRLMQTQTTGLHNLILDKFLLMSICLPPLYEQRRIIDQIETIFTTLNLIMESL
ncbi:type I restriction modification DNA specificity domain protein [Bacteroides fragilis str. B1 (UDC16-1)]|nr:type I restriction modification DNA specificity domain protein [Bacteroides fragilis str. B1 (UDC16-1)]